MRKLLIILLLPVFAKAQFTMPSTVGFNKPVTSSAPLSPKDTAGLLLWVYSDTLTGLSDGDPVSTWTDLSGNGNNATQTGSDRPLFKTNIQNSKAALLFDGTSDWMDIANTTALSGSTGFTVFAVVKQPTMTANRAILTKWDYATQGTFAIQSSDVSTIETMMYVADACGSAGSDHQNSTDAVLTTDFYLLTYVYDGTQANNADRVKIYKNGTLVSMTVSGTIPTVLPSCSATLKIGDFGGAIINNRWWPGYIGEILLYDHALTPTGQTTWNDWLKKPDRWGL